MIYYELCDSQRKYPSVTAAVAHAKLRRDFVSIFRVIDTPERFFREFVHLAVMRPTGEVRLSYAVDNLEMISISKTAERLPGLLD